MSGRVRIMDIAQKTVTLGLFGVTVYGAVVFGDGAYDIMKRRMTSGPIGSPNQTNDSNTHTQGKQQDSN